MTTTPSHALKNTVPWNPDVSQLLPSAKEPMLKLETSQSVIQPTTFALDAPPQLLPIQVLSLQTVPQPQPQTTTATLQMLIIKVTTALCQAASQLLVHLNKIAILREPVFAKMSLAPLRPLLLAQLKFVVLQASAFSALMTLTIRTTTMILK